MGLYEVVIGLKYQGVQSWAGVTVVQEGVGEERVAPVPQSESGLAVDASVISCVEAQGSGVVEVTVSK